MGANYVDVPPAAVVLALQYWSGDEAQAMRLARLLADIEPARRTDVVLAFFRRFDQPETEALNKAYFHAAAKFPVAVFRSSREGTGHPHGCNELWSAVMEALTGCWQRGSLRAHSVFTLEADGVPLRRDWLDVLLAEHQRTLEAGKRVTGALMNSPTLHVNGSLIAHLSLWERASLHRTPPEQAWDLFHAAVLTSETRPTSWLKNLYGAGNWSPESLEVLARETAWLASSKDESALAWAERTLVARARAPEPGPCPGCRGELEVFTEGQGYDGPPRYFCSNLGCDALAQPATVEELRR